MTPLIKKYDFDLNRLLPGTPDLIKSYSSDGEMLFLPYTTTKLALYYNKEIFDKLGVNYPTDNMTWDEIYSLANDLSREVEGVQYKGFVTEVRQLLAANQLGLALIDPETNKSAINSDGWKLFFENLARFYKIPGNELTGNMREFFLTEKIAAMWVASSTYINDRRLIAGQDAGLDWDLVTAPKFAESSGSQIVGSFYGITTTSPHKDAAMQVINYLMSDEVQMMTSKMGRMSFINSKEVQDAFSSDRPDLLEKNLAAFYEDTSGNSGKNQSSYCDAIRAIINNCKIKTSMK